MPGYRLGNGTEADAREFANKGLPPSWSPFNPWHYLTFSYWACTFSFTDYDLSKKLQFDKRVGIIMPWLVSIAIWSSLIFLLIFVEFAIIPHSYQLGPVFPYTAPQDPPEELAQHVGVKAESAEQIEVELQTSDVNESGELAGKDDEAKKETEKTEPEPKFIDIFVGIPGLKAPNNRNVIFGLCLILIAAVITAKYSTVFGGLLALITAFGIGSVISTKVFFWLTEPTTRLLFLTARILETALLLIMSARLKQFYTASLSLMSSVLAVFASCGFSVAMLTSEAQLVLDTSVILPLVIILLAIPVLPLIRGSLTPKEALSRKFELWLVFIAPFCMATLLNWWFHLSWLNDIDIPKTSYKNTLVIYLVGLVFGFALLVLRHVTRLSSKRFSWPLVLLSLLLIVNVFLINNLFSTYPLHLPPPPTDSSSPPLSTS